MPKDAEATTIDGLAKQALDEADGDWGRAAAIFRTWVDFDQEIKDAILEPFLERGIWRAIRRAASFHRGWLERKTTPVDQVGIEAMAGAYFSYPLVGGLKLGDATINILEVERDMHQQFATANDLKARRFQLIIDVMTKKRAAKDKTVRELMSHDKLLEIWEEARNE